MDIPLQSSSGTEMANLLSAVRVAAVQLPVHLHRRVRHEFYYQEVPFSSCGLFIAAKKMIRVFIGALLETHKE
jgi:hypothetical protein